MNDPSPTSPRHQLRIPASPRNNYQTQQSPYVHSPRKVAISSPRRHISTSSLSPMTQPGNMFFANSPSERGRPTGSLGLSEKLPPSLPFDGDTRIQRQHQMTPNFNPRSPRIQDVNVLEELPLSSRYSASSSSSIENGSLTPPKNKSNIDSTNTKYDPPSQDIFYYSQAEQERMIENMSMREYLEETVSDLLLNGT